MVLRVVAHGADALLGEAYFETALRRAVALRRDIFQLDATTDAYRLVNSDGDGLSGLIVDRYADTLLCEVTSFGMARRLPGWLPLLHELAGTKFARVHVDHDLGSLEGIKPSWFNETNAAAPARVKIREHGIRYEVDFAEGHKTGFSAISAKTVACSRSSPAAPACSTCAATVRVSRSMPNSPAGLRM